MRDKLMPEGIVENEDLKVVLPNIETFDWEDLSLDKCRHQVMWKVPKSKDTSFIHNFRTGETVISKDLCNKYLVENGRFVNPYARDLQLEKEYEGKYFFGQEDAIDKISFAEFVLIGKHEEKIKTKIIETSDGQHYFVVRFFSFTGHIPKYKEIGLLKEWKRTYISLDDHTFAFDEYRRDKNRMLWRKFDIKRFLTWLDRKYEILTANRTYHIVNLHCINNKYVNDLDLIKDIPCKKRDIKSQKIVDKYQELLLSKQIEEDHSIIKHYQSVVSDRESIEYNSFLFDFEDKKEAFIERINDNLIVIHCYGKNVYNDKPFEYACIFVDKENVYPCYMNNKNEPIINNVLRNRYWDCFLDEESYDVKGTILELKLNNISEIQKPIMAILFANKFLYFEQLIKLGYVSVAEEMYLSYQYNNDKHWWKQKRIKPNTTVSSFFYGQLQNIKPLLKKEKLRDIIDFLYIIRVYNLSLNNYSEKEILFIFRYRFMLGRISDTLLQSKISKEEMPRILRKIIKSDKYIESEGALRYLRDTIDMEIQFQQHLNPNLSTVQKRNFIKKIFKMNTNFLKNYHDNLSVKIRVIGFEIHETGFNKEREKFSYLGFTDSDFSIIVPKNKEDVLREGEKLSHCVGSYVPKIAKGETFVVFLRKNSNINKPYFTIEVCKNQIRQAYGYRNETGLVDLTKEELKFIGLWKKEKKINK